MKRIIIGLAGALITTTIGICGQAQPVAKGDNYELHDAVKADDLSKVRELIAKKVEVDAQDKDGGTPLLYAAVGNHLEIVRALLDGGAKIDIETKQKLTPLCLVSYRGHDGVAQLLIERGADIEHKGEDGDTPLNLASRRGHAKIVEMLLDKKAAVDKRANDGMTPLHFACLNGHDEVVRLLLAHGADFNAIQPNAMPPRTPILMAAWNGHKDVLKLLAEKKANDNWLTKIEGFSVDNLRPMVVSRSPYGHVTHGVPTGLALGAWLHSAVRPWKAPEPPGPSTMANNLFRWDQPGRGDYLSLLIIRDNQRNETFGQFLLPAYISSDQVVYPDGITAIKKGGPFAVIRAYWLAKAAKETEQASKTIRGTVRIYLGERAEELRADKKGELVYTISGVKRWEPVGVVFNPSEGTEKKRIEFDCVLRGATPTAVVYSVYYQSR